MGIHQDRLFEALQDNNNSEVTIHIYFVNDAIRHTGIFIRFTDAFTNVTSEFTIDVTIARRGGNDRLQELLRCVFWHVEAEMAVNQIFPGQQSRNYTVKEPFLRLPLDWQQDRCDASSRVEKLLKKTSETYNLATNNCRDHSGRQIQQMCSDNQCNPNAVNEAQNTLQERRSEDAVVLSALNVLTVIAGLGLIWWAIKKKH